MTKKRKRRDSKKVRKTMRRSASSLFSSKAAFLRKVRQWPLLECLIHEDWRDTTKITQILVVRQSFSGEVATGAFVIDLACLGVKNAYAARFATAGEYRRELRSRITSSQTMAACDLDLAAKVVQTAIEYAGSLGFKPNKDTKDALMVLGETHPENCDIEVPVGGEDGQPLFIAGPYDNVNSVMRKLNRAVGEGNYDFIAPIGPSDLFEGEFDEEDWEELDE